MRELLEELRDYIAQSNRTDYSGQREWADDLLARIDAALPAPEPSAGEIVEKIRMGGYALNANDPDDRGPNGDDYHFALTDSEAAALIASVGRRVPRAMLWEIQGDDRIVHPAFDDSNAVMDAIAAKYGVKMEG